MKLKNIKSDQKIKVGPILKNYLKPLLACASSTLSATIGLLSSPVYAEDQLPVLHTPRSTSFELNIPLRSDPSKQNHAVENSNTGLNVVTSNVVTSNKVPDRISAQDLPTASDELVYSAQSLKQVASLSIGSPIEALEPDFSPNHVAQADIPTSQPSEPAAHSGSSDRWQFSVEPYFFVPLDVQADVTVAGRSTSIKLGLGDVLNLDRAFDAGLRLKAQHDRLGFILDAFYVSVGQSGNIGVTLPQGSLQRFGIDTAARLNADASLSIREVTVDAAVSYRVVDTVLGKSAGTSNPYPRLVIAPILGLRTDVLWQKLEVDAVRIGNVSLPIARDYHVSKTTVEPLLGAQIDLDLSERWAVNVRGDVSGFDIGADRNLDWNLLIGTQYRLSPSFSLQLAYRFNAFYFEDGEGLRRTRLDLYQNGLVLSSIFRF